MILGYAPNATDNIHNEAITRVVEYLFTVNSTGPGGSANIPLIAGRDINLDVLSLSGAASLLARYRVHRAGLVAATAQAAARGIATGNPLTNVDLAGSTLTFTYQDGTTKELTLPSGGGGMGSFQASASLPSTVDIGELVFYNGVIYEGIGESRVTTQLVRGTSGDDDGFIRGQYGRFNPDIPYIDALYYDDDQDNVVLRLNSLSNPGNITVQLPGGRTLPFVDAGRTAYTIQKAGNRQYHVASGDDPFLVGGSSYNITVIFQNSINHWRSWAAPDVATWALVGDPGRVPESKIPLDIARVSQIPAGGTDDQNASEVATNTSQFNNNLSSADDTVQKALDTLDNLIVTGGSPGSGQTASQVRALIANLVASWALKANDSAVIPASKLPDRAGSDVTLVTTMFNNNLSAGDDTVQKAMETLDDVVASGGGGLDANAVRALISSWALSGNTSLIPAVKLRSKVSTSSVQLRYGGVAALDIPAGSVDQGVVISATTPTKTDDDAYDITVTSGQFTFPNGVGTVTVGGVIREPVTVTGAVLTNQQQWGVSGKLYLRNVTDNTREEIGTGSVGESGVGRRTQNATLVVSGQKEVTIVDGKTYSIQLEVSFSATNTVSGTNIAGTSVQFNNTLTGSFSLNRNVGSVKDYALIGGRNIQEPDLDPSIVDKINPHYENIFETLLDDHTFGLPLTKHSSIQKN